MWVWFFVVFVEIDDVENEDCNNCSYCDVEKNIEKIDYVGDIDRSIGYVYVMFVFCGSDYG